MLSDKAIEAGARAIKYADIYKNLSGVTALIVASQTPLRKQKDEKDTEFVKRIVAHYIAAASAWEGRK